MIMKQSLTIERLITGDTPWRSLRAATVSVPSFSGSRRPLASDHGTCSQTSSPSSVVKITGMVLG